MSSHHVVREKQEPALLILGMDLFDEEHLGQLLEWSPTVLVTDETLEKLDSFGIKFDVLITKNTSNQLLQNDVRLVHDHENLPVKTALQFLISNHYPAVNIITNEFLAADYLNFTSQINLVIYCGNQKIYAVNSGFSKWKAAGETISVYDLPADLEQSGLEQINPNQFKTKTDGFFTLKFNQRFLFIAEEI
jgi:thiamine pyrophosphokinase